MIFCLFYLVTVGQYHSKLLIISAGNQRLQKINLKKLNAKHNFCTPKCFDLTQKFICIALVRCEPLTNCSTILRPAHHTGFKCKNKRNSHTEFKATSVLVHLCAAQRGIIQVKLPCLFFCSASLCSIPQFHKTDGLSLQSSNVLKHLNQSQR